VSVVLSPFISASDPRSEAELVEAAKRNDEAAIRSIIRVHNRMLFRLARSILPSDDEAEDAVQAAYMRGFEGLASFRGEARLGTWLGRIVLNEALGRARRQRPTVALDELESLPSADIIVFPASANAADPERAMAEQQTRHMLEQAIDELPEAFRTVLVARLIEEMSVDETARLLGLRPETVKTRLHRARVMLRSALEKQFGAALNDIYPFAGERCQRMADRVVAALRERS
jgi:RNA polymerase sigma-70 factor (ECF subfamily)